MTEASRRTAPAHILRSRRVVTDSGTGPADLVLRDGLIEQILDHGAAGGDSALAGLPVDDCGDAMVMPALIDVHCHINEPGREDWEGFRTATRAAAAGGITLLMDMPLNSDPVTIDEAALTAKLGATVDQLHVDVGFYGGVVPANAGRQQDLAELSRAGVSAFKCFLCDSGLDAFPPVARRELEQAMPIIAKLGKRLLAHAEIFDANSAGGTPSGRSAEAADAASTQVHPIIGEFLSTRPPRCELEAVELLAELCESTQCPVHIVHLSTARALPRLREFRSQGLPITVETCPHYLTFAAEEIDPDVRFKCTPPIRSADNREALWQGLADGTIDFIATDHSPCPPSRKFPAPGRPVANAWDEWDRAWGGIASLQLLLPAVWTEARRRGHTEQDLVRWLCAGPAAWLGSPDRGAIRPGNRADLVVWEPERSFTVRSEALEHRHPISPYDGRTLDGVVLRTIHRGHTAFEADGVDGTAAEVPNPSGAAPTRFGSSLGRAVRRRAGADALYVHADQVVGQPAEALRPMLRSACGSQRWVDEMLAGAPYSSLANFWQATETGFDALDAQDWLEAFAAHPRIGDLESLRARYGRADALAANEQAGTREADDETLERLAHGNDAYEQRFGHVFLICASGKSARAMLDALHRRLGNEPEVELRLAAEEQRKITFLRLASGDRSS